MERMNMVKISIIIPIYNTESYLVRCLDSVTKQSLYDIEIICVNDASPGNAMQILDKYARNDDRIKIIDFADNKGVAAARNAGIETSQGAYLGFVDSDDAVDLDLCEKLYAKACETRNDIVQAPIAIPNGPKRNEYINWRWFCSSIYNHSFINDNLIRFPNGVEFEDVVFMCRALIKAKSISKIHDSFYNYYQTPQSSSRNCTPEKYKKLIIANNIIFSEIKSSIDIAAISDNKACALIDSFLETFCILCQFKYSKFGQYDASVSLINFFHKFDNYPTISKNILKNEPSLQYSLSTSDINAVIECLKNRKKSMAAKLRSSVLQNEMLL
jgi:glycosyltransferase involved in cell wall biosynthesis